jgi:hypothetical protein
MARAFRELAGALAIASGPIRSFATKVRVVCRRKAPRCSVKSFDDSAKFFELMGSPGEVKLRRCHFSIARKRTDRGAMSSSMALTSSLASSARWPSWTNARMVQGLFVIVPAQFISRRARLGPLFSAAVSECRDFWNICFDASPSFDVGIVWRAALASG